MTTTSKVRLLVDADPFVYRVGFAANDEPVSHCLHTLKRSIALMEAGVAEFLEANGDSPGNMEFYLTGGRNFRMKVATIKGYKANREDMQRPTWYNEIREYLVKYKKAEVVNGYEADDKVAMEQYQARPFTTIICSVDKDLLMVPGYHWDYRVNEGCIVSELEGTRFFFKQLLTGDVTDNIPGCYYIGDKTADTMLENCSSREEMLEVVKEAYRENAEKYPEHHGGLPWKKSLLQNGRLLWMMRHPDDLWHPTKELSLSKRMVKRRTT